MLVILCFILCFFRSFSRYPLYLFPLKESGKRMPLLSGLKMFLLTRTFYSNRQTEYQ